MATQNKNLSDYDKTQLQDISQKRFAIITSEWNSDITYNMRQGAIDTLTDCGALKQNIIQWSVPGSFELINGARRMLDTNSVDAIIVIGCVIQGETKHFDYVCQGVTQGIAHLNAIQNIPVIFCVLTDNTKEQSLARSGGVHGNKGIEAAISAIKMVTL